MSDAQRPTAARCCQLGGVALVLALAAPQARGTVPLGDPMRPAGIAAPAPVAENLPHLAGILERAGQRVAIVDGRLVHEGDWVGAVLIEHIGADTVVCVLAGRTLLLRLDRADAVLHPGWLADGTDPTVRSHAPKSDP